MESRSIDFAKTASIDMMTLNNKVVNMRHIVKRAKVHVISKLCRHIHKLKMKQYFFDRGSEEHKSKNLRKAQRLIEEIDSMKKLKEDNVSKYALASTASFDDMSKVSLLPGPRALARLADHPLMKKVVTDFRNQHSDWSDLAAYLLVKQTGRRFKTKKQKQKKLEICVENMHACETMTKAYIQGRFGQEGLVKAEQTFERKRKRPKSVISGKNADSQSKDDDSLQKTKQTTEKTNSETSEQEDLIETEKVKSDTSEADDFIENKNNQQEISKHNVQIMMEEKGQENQGQDVIKQRLLTKKKQQKPHVVCGDSGDIGRETANGQISADISDVSSLEDIRHSDHSGHPQASSECVVRELSLQNTHDIALSSDEDDNIEKQKTRQIPEFLTKANKTVISDPFFVGSDDDEEEEGLEHKITCAGFSINDDDNSDLDTVSGRAVAKSTFYIPGLRGKRGASSERFHRGVSGRQSWDRRNVSCTSNAGQWGRAHGNHERAFRGDSRGWTFRGDSRGRGSSFRGAETFTSNAHDGRDGPRATGSLARVNSSLRSDAAKLQTSHTFLKANQTIPGKLHPSWEASKKRRAEQSSITSFQGSRLTFDDDD